jgi:hypothetical protein
MLESFIKGKIYVDLGKKEKKKKLKYLKKLGGRRKRKIKNL